MAFLVRKVSRSKWPDRMHDIGEIRADAVADIRTYNDCLSMWRIDSLSEYDIDRAALALSASSKTSKIEKLDLIIVCESDINKLHIEIEDEEGDTIVENLRGLHCNLVKLKYNSLRDIASLIIDNLFIKSHIIGYPKMKVTEMLVQAYKDGFVDTTICNKDLHDELDKRVSK